MKKSIAVLLCCIVITCHVTAQKTAALNDDALSYKTGLELYQQKKYGSALKQFNQFINRFGSSNDEAKYHEYMIDALFYRAESSNELDQPQAEKYFLDLIADYEPTPLTEMAYYYLGNIYYKKKRFNLAINYFNQVKIADLTEDQMNEYRFQLGYCYFVKKKFDKAEPLFSIIKDVKNKYYFPSNYYYAYISYTKGNYDEALKAFNVIKDSKLYGPIIPYYTASIAFIQKRYNDAIELANNAIQNDKLKYHDELKQLIGKSYFCLQQYDKALPYLKGYYDNVSKAGKSDIYEIGYCQYQLKDYEAAITSFTQLNTLRDSIGQSALYLLGDCDIKTDKKNNARNAFFECSKIDIDKKLKEDAAYQYAKLTYELGYNDQAIAAMQSFMKAYPNTSYMNEAREILTNIFLNTNNYKDAIKVIQSMANQTAAIKQAYQKVAYGYGIQLYNDNNYTDALGMFEVSLNNPIDPTVQALCYFWKGESYYAQNKYSEANQNYFKFLETSRLTDRLPLSTSSAAANYGVGYCYLKKNDYKNAITYFEKCEQALKEIHKLTTEDNAYYSKVYPDCILRTGDCYFALRDYSKASAAYTKVIDKSYPGSDYALFERGMLNGLMGNTDAKISDLQAVYNEHGTSDYKDDALFETGETYLKAEQFENAVLIFNQVINDYPSSTYVKNSHLELGLIYLNTNRMSNALDEYKLVASKYPNTTEAKDAIKGIKEICKTSGDVDLCEKVLSTLPNANFSASEKDSLVYSSAEMQLNNENYDAALQKFSDYINGFPEGAFINDAHYYRALCLSHNKDYGNALIDFEYIITKNDSRFIENSLLQAAQIDYYTSKNYTDAYKYYSQLSKIANLKINIFEARKGMMLSAFQLKQYSDAKINANDIVNDNQSTQDDINEANYIIGKSALDGNQYNDAINSFKKVSIATKTALGAEATYLVAQCYFNLNDIKNAEEWSYKVINSTPNYDYWLAKSYILLADIFQVKGDLFNAKATLQSIIDKYNHDDDIVPTAKEKLATVEAAENSQSKMMNDSTKNSFDEDNLINKDTDSTKTNPNKK